SIFSTGVSLHVWGPEPTVPLWKVRLDTFKRFGLDAWIGAGIGFGNPNVEVEKKIVAQEEELIMADYIYKTPKGKLVRKMAYPKYDGEWTVKYTVDDPVKDLPKLEAMLNYDPWQGYDAGGFERIKEAVGEDGLVYATGGHPALDWWSYLRGSQAGIMDIYDHWDTIAPLWERYEMLDLEKTRIACREGAELIYGGGSFTTLSLISPEWYKRFVYPHLKKAAEICHQEGVFFCVQVNGKCNDVLDILADAGVGCTEPLERSPLGDVDIGDAKRRIGKTVCLKGNVDPVNTLLKGTPEDVDKEIREIVETAGSDGTGLIVSTSDQTCRDTPVENMEAFRKAVEKYGSDSC
ncbi:uroporphyrinogen decarboxylase family protein, partial [Verrucomicrobiota bacterium]